MARHLSLLLWLVATGCPKFDRRSENLAPPVAIITVAPRGPVPASTRVVLDGSQSFDPEGRPLAYRWLQSGGDAVLLEGMEADPARPYFIAPDEPQALIFDLVVSDGLFDSERARVRIAVVEQNEPPVAAIAPMAVAPIGEELVLDGSGSRDLETPLDRLRFAWTSPSHPSLAFRPSAYVPKPTVMPPGPAGAPLVVQLSVTDSRGASSAATLSIPMVPGAGSHVLVDASAVCSPCDGSHQRPFASIGEGVRAAAASEKPVLVAKGVYSATVVGEPVTLVGGCQPPAWTCDGGVPSRIRAGPGDAVALDLLPTGLASIHMSNFAVQSTRGEMLDGGATSIAVRCRGCSASLDSFDVLADGEAPPVRTTVGLWVENTSGPFRLARSTVKSGTAHVNYAVHVRDAIGVTVEDSLLTSSPLVRQGLGNNRCPPPDWAGYTANMVVWVGGVSQSVLFKNNRIIGEATQRANRLNEVVLADSARATFAGNFIFHRGAPAQPSTVCADGWFANAALLLRHEGGARFVNNTVVASTVARGVTPFNAFTSRRDGLAPARSLDELVNNYVEGFEHAVYRGPPNESNLATFRLLHNTLYDNIWALGENPSHSDGGVLNDGAGAVVPGSGNFVADRSCLAAPRDLAEPALRPGSACIDNGVFDVDAPERDLDGQVRPLDGGIDRGADEWAP